MKIRRHIAAFAWLSLLASGCTSQSSGLHNRHEILGAGLLSGQGDGFALEGITFLVTPASIRACEHPDLRMSAEVMWNAQIAGVKNVAIWISNGASPPKKWLSGHSSGSAKTGEWVVNNSTLQMTDDDSGAILAVRRVYVVQCLDDLPSATQ
jgi:hypothetical protein